MHRHPPRRLLFGHSSFVIPFFNPQSPNARAAEGPSCRIGAPEFKAIRRPDAETYPPLQGLAPLRVRPPRHRHQMPI